MNDRQSSAASSSESLQVACIIEELQKMGDPRALKGMARFGIQTRSAYGVSVPQLRLMARRIGKSHDIAVRLWRTGIHDARLLAGMVDDPKRVTEEQMEEWANGFDSWDVVDGTCGNLFDKTPYAVNKAREWSRREEEYVKRAGFVLMAVLAVHDKKADNRTFLDFLPAVVRESADDRNFVKKAVNWALRQIGKRNLALNKAAVRTCRSIQRRKSVAGRWIAADALRELTSQAVQKKLKDASRSRRRSRS